MSPLRVIENPHNVRVNFSALSSGAILEDSRVLELSHLKDIFGISQIPAKNLLSSAGLAVDNGIAITSQPIKNTILVGDIPLFIRTAQGVNTTHSTHPEQRYHLWAEELDGQPIDTRNDFRFRTKNQILFEYTYPRTRVR